jgi:uncharacterized membrane protein
MRNQRAIGAFVVMGRGSLGPLLRREISMISRILAPALAAALVLGAGSLAARADETGAFTGGVAGAVGGAVVGGPVGAVVGGVGGAAIGNSMTNHRHYYHRYGYRPHHHYYENH